MEVRNEDLERFVLAASVAYSRHVCDAKARESLRRIFAMLTKPDPAGLRPGARLPVCRHLPEAAAGARADPVLSNMLDCFMTLEPLLTWTTRTKHDGSAGPNFAEGHANAMVLGPGGLEERKDLWIGTTLMAPNIRYPDHFHAPEETYLVLSEGEFRQGDGEWFSPGVGGSFYNPPNIKHAMRSQGKPLLAFWALLV
ncbi:MULTISPECIES: dimethylsulfoniopropionate lyase [Rhizobium/Agrobacterium group]|uniref:dimethylsulfoniopropionate lyase n=1 Tax=Rhizobium/Agrobacterium group TaxID=227290 RepID=UPI001ADAC39D|nr:MULTISPECIES: dimethylsulfoniopropionate lyase [Rhizobium/Agrobacterium group]MBO9112695.1 dimethylsulfoniopropionate lyase [Agrobacterium sp. S2/73]QXZ76184.1 dimethylsulfoniopropionate lyase [Agrobacterium sp. S7/73]QYA17267.1 dimethylsulfoniopropionate lyase [Rhizobium sp. AB2/73]UEQ85616.1 dimethylsulfoniopropionate lyase [Rhizobium sp. AB2/73]